MNAATATWSGIRYSCSEGVGHIALARPEVSNSVDLPTARSLAEVIEQVAADENVRVILLTGDGSRFCAGGDVTSMAAASDQTAAVRELADTMDLALQRLSALDKPVIVAVQGAAAGAGLALVLAADLVLSARSTKYLTAYAAIGLTPDCGLSWLLPRAVGQQRALELALTGRVLSADEAREWGLVTTVVDDADLDAQARVLAQKLAAGPASALGQTRRLIRSSWTATRAESGADESATISRAVAAPEARVLMEKFAASPQQTNKGR